MRALLWCAVCVVMMTATPAVAQPVESAAPPLDQLIEQFNAGAPALDGVEIDAWTEPVPGGAELVVVIAPRNGTKLVADPGITVTPTPRAGVEWRTPVPHRKVDPDRDYFTPPATVRLLFAASDGEPVEVLVEYAWCVVDFQCFFGEELLTVASRSP